MKRIFIFLLSLALAACGAPPAPTAAPTQPTPTAVVVVQTVVVTVIPTQAPTEVPSATPLPPPTEVPPTQAIPIEDRGTGAVFDWQNAGRMLPDASGNFALVFSGENVNANFRKPNAWFDYQFIGLSKSGGVVGRSEKIVQQVTYTLDCP